MDKIIINKLEVFANHGVLQEEKKLGQKFIVSAELHLCLRRAGFYDDLNQTINYAEVCQTITGMMQAQNYDLIETCAEQIATLILMRPLVKAVQVTIEKPWAPIGLPLQSASVQVFRKWHRIYLGLGSNMGDSKALLDTAINHLEADDLRVLNRSSYHQTKPVSDIPQADYLNCVVEAETTMLPRQLLAQTMQIESSLGRDRTDGVINGPRPIDIDILTYDDIISDDREIILPHPRMHQRLFVLEPFCELNPYYLHPLLNKRVIDIKENLI